MPDEPKRKKADVKWKSDKSQILIVEETVRREREKRPKVKQS